MAVPASVQQASMTPDQVNTAGWDKGWTNLVKRAYKQADYDQVMFVIPQGGVEVTPGQTYRLKLSGGTTFGWKYIVGGYEKGAATFNGKPLLPNERSTFLFRTFGAE
jgi:hypothetical protein